MVEDVDPNGKIRSSRSATVRRHRWRCRRASDDTPAEASDDRESVSFESAFDSDLADEFGDLGPEALRRSGGGGGRGRGRGGRGRR